MYAKTHAHTNTHTETENAKIMMRLEDKAFEEVPVQVQPQASYLLCSKGEGCACDARRQMQSLDDFLPQLLVDDVYETSTGNDQIVQLVQIQHGFGHNWQTINGCS